MDVSVDNATVFVLQVETLLLHLRGSVLKRKMALGGTAPPRGSAAATASMRRRRTTGGAASGGAAGTMLQFYTDDAPGLKISPNVVLVMSIGFIAFVAILHVMGKLYFVRREA
ncbi:Protein transport protein Sec61 subunit beta [Glycine soja]|nr:Protein transport protein Sec61 subunit beta [Glycine soja]